MVKRYRETADAIQNRLQDYSKDEEIAEGLLYTNEALELLQLPDYNFNCYMLTP